MCGCGFDTIDYEVVKIVQGVCDAFECSVVINSACRCEDHNRSVGGGESSQHLLGRALDCRFVGIGTDYIHQYLCNKYPDQYGLGKYASFNHIDSRGIKARWEG